MTRSGVRGMRRPIGVMLLAGAAGLAGLYQLYLMLVYLGIVKFEVIGKSVAFGEAQWGAALWALLIAVIWFWVAAGFWNLRAYALLERAEHIPREESGIRNQDSERRYTLLER